MMRGGAFHNMIVATTRDIFIRSGWHAYTEYPYQSNRVRTYLDLFAIRGGDRLACEIETTARHAVDNAVKAQVVNVPLWIVVPSRKIQRQITHKLQTQNLVSHNQSIPVLLLGQLERQLACYS